MKGVIEIKITDVRIRRMKDEPKMKAIVSVTFNDQFVVHDIKVIEGINGIFVAMPSRKLSNGEFRDIAHPINSEARKKIENTVLEEYEKKLLLEEKI